MSVKEIVALLMKKWHSVARVVCILQSLRVPLQVGEQFTADAVSYVGIAKEVNVHALAGRGVEESEDALIHSPQWHEGLVKNAVAGAKELTAPWVSAVGYPAEPSLLARVEPKAQKDARQATGRQLVVGNLIAPAEDRDSAAEVLEPGDVGLGAVMNLPGGLFAGKR